MAKAPKSTEIEVVSLKQGEVTFCIVGDSPLLFNAMNAKARRELLAPSGRKTAGQKANNAKHDPIVEFRNSCEKDYRPNAPTRIVLPSPAFKGAIATAAIDMPTSVARTQIKRLTYLPERKVSVWGIPLLHMCTVRMADINRTPDIRTRAFMEEWCAKFTIRFVEPMLTANAVATLLAAAGIVCGVGDGRQEKGALDCGRFRLVSEDDPDFQRIMATGGREAQDAALANPVAANADTEEMFDWFENEYRPNNAAKFSRANDDDTDEDEAVEAAE